MPDTIYSWFLFNFKSMQHFVFYIFSSFSFVFIEYKKLPTGDRSR